MYDPRGGDLPGGGEETGIQQRSAKSDLREDRPSHGRRSHVASVWCCPRARLKIKSHPNLRSLHRSINQGLQSI